jgi:hypothetical protein
VLAAIGSAGCAATLLYDRRPYTQDALARWRAREGGVQVHFHTAEGHQVAFYLPPPAGAHAPPERLWVLFAGVHHQALGWLARFDTLPDPGAGLLLMDYPGYGLCQGRPSAAAIRKAATAGLAALGARLGLAPEDLAARLHILGHSLGSGPAVDLALEMLPRRLVLISPWTTFREVGRHLYGRFSGTLAYWVVGEEYDNRAGLARLGRVSRPPHLTVVHGAADKVIPTWMGRELVETYAGPKTWHEIPGRGHDGILEVVFPAVLVSP